MNAGDRPEGNIRSPTTSQVPDEVNVSEANGAVVSDERKEPQNSRDFRMVTGAAHVLTVALLIAPDLLLGYPPSLLVAGFAGSLFAAYAFSALLLVWTEGLRRWWAFGALGVAVLSVLGKVL